MTCPECNKLKQNPLDKFSIDKQKRCADCYKKWIELPENNPDYKTFQVRASGSARFEVRALDQEMAHEKAYELLEDADWDFDIWEEKETL